jgi:hypothetical protein
MPENRARPSKKGAQSMRSKHHAVESRDAMKRIGPIACCTVLVLATCCLQVAHAERWVQASPVDSRVWYDADNVRATAAKLITVWISTGPTRTNTAADGKTSYPAYTIIDCKERTAGSKLSLDFGEPLATYAANSGMGALIAKLCS